MIDKKFRLYGSQTKRIQQLKRLKRISHVLSKKLPLFQTQIGSTLNLQTHFKKNQKTIFVFKGNNHQLLLKQFMQLGYQSVNSKNQSDLIWVQTSTQLPQIPASCQFINYIFHHQALTHKQKMYKNLIKYNKGIGLHGKYVPDSYTIDFKSQTEECLIQFLNRHFSPMSMRGKLSKLQQKNGIFQISNSFGQFRIPFRKIQPSNLAQRQQKIIWILKPTTLNRGRGISLFTSTKQLKELLSEDSVQMSVQMYSDTIPNSTYIIQQYIQNPLLIEGYKFDVRMWMLLTLDKRSRRLKAYMYEEGYLRLSGTKYHQSKQNQEPQQNDFNGLEGKSKSNSPLKGDKNYKDTSIQKHLNNKYMHLTNNAVQKNSKNYGVLFEGNQMSLKDLEKYFSGRIQLQTLLNQFRMMMMDTVNSVKNQLSDKKTTKTQHFQLFGYDFLIDSQIHPWLLQVNCNPCLEESSGLLKRLIPTMITSMIKILNLSANNGFKETHEDMNQGLNLNVPQQYQKDQMVRSTSLQQKQQNPQKILKEKQELQTDNKWLRIL